MANKLFEPVEKAELERADAIAKLVVDFTTDDQGRDLANVHTSQAFQEIYDYKGG